MRRPPVAHPTDRPPPEAAYRPGWLPRRAVNGDPDRPAPADAGGGLRKPARPAWALAAGLAAWAVVYPAAFLFRVVPLWPALAALAAVSWWAAWHPYLATRLRPTPRLLAMGALSGLALYALFCAGALVLGETPLWPLVQDAAELPRTTVPAVAAALLIVLVTSPSEEVLWRGAVFARLTRRYGPGWRPVAGTTVLYALFVGLSGSLALVAAALVCGTVWARQRQVTGSIVPGLVSHALWSLLMFLYIPGLPWP
jgi:membrane protease YdiL (CAAX protease family)